MLNNFFLQKTIDLNSPIQEDEFVLKYEEEHIDPFSFFNQNSTSKLIFDYPNFLNNLEGKKIEVENFIDFKENFDEKIKEKKIEIKKLPTVELSTNLTNIADKNIPCEEFLVQITNLLNGKTDEEILVLNEKKMKSSDKNGLLGKKRKLINQQKKKLKNKNKKCGRKKKDSNEKGDHTKCKEDNMIAKIKNFIFNSALNLLNHSYIYIDEEFIPTRKNNFENKFLKINSQITHSIKKEANLSLLDMKLKDILSNKISSKYSSVDKNHNKILIQNIYEDKKETNIISILELTFRDILNVFRGTVSAELEKKINEIVKFKEKFCNIEIFCEVIKNQEIDKKENEEFIANYVKQLKKLCYTFEEWFSNKQGRDRK